MATIEQRINKNGTKSWRALVRIKGYPTASRQFARKREAEDWARETEQKIRLGKYNFNRDAEQKTLADLIDRYINDGAVKRHKASKDTVRHLNYFRERIGAFALVHLNPEKILEERKTLLETPTHRGTPRNTATVNRYMSSLSGAFNYALRALRWIDESPCANLIKLQESPKKRRILTQQEEVQLLKASKESRSSYLYCLTLIGLTTGMRLGEILALEWNDVDFTNRCLFVRTSKNNQPRTVPIGPATRDELKQRYNVRDPKKPLVFASKTAFGKLDPKKAFKGALKRAGIKDFVFHGLRHNYCTKAGAIGATGGQLRAQLGHTTSKMTDHYSHLDCEAVRHLGETLEARLLEEVGDE